MRAMMIMKNESGAEKVRVGDLILYVNMHLCVVDKTQSRNGA